MNENHICHVYYIRRGMETGKEKDRLPIDGK